MSLKDWGWNKKEDEFTTKVVACLCKISLYLDHCDVSNSEYFRELDFAILDC